MNSMKTITPASQQTYIALLRGINVGGYHKVPMATLRQSFDSMGYGPAKTLLNTGNVLFKAAPDQEAALTPLIAARLKDTFGFSIPVIVHSQDHIQQLVTANPFKDIQVTPSIRLYASFLSDTPIHRLSLPYTSPDESFSIIAIIDRTVFSVLDLAISRTVDAMSILEKEFGKNMTTRNWNTILKLAQR